jgi:hypothetical protein
MASNKRQLILGRRFPFLILHPRLREMPPRMLGASLILNTRLTENKALSKGLRKALNAMVLVVPYCGFAISSRAKALNALSLAPRLQNLKPTKFAMSGETAGCRYMECCIIAALEY